MNVVVAGGTGFLGRRIARHLLDAGHDVSVLGRDPNRARGISDLEGATAVQGDVTQPQTLTGKLSGADVVVQAVQFPNHPIEVPRRGLTYDRYDRQGTENLVREAVRSEVGRFLYISGAGADPASDKTWFRAKGRAETSLRAAEIDHLILRPSWAYGPGDRALNRFVTIARLSPVVPQPGVTPQRIQPVYVEDIAMAVERAVADASVWNKTYEIGSREVLTMNDVIHTLLDVMGKKRLVLPVPAPLIKLATAPLVALPNPPMTPAGIDFATGDGLVDVGPMVRALGVEPVSLREGLQRYIRVR